MRSGLHVVSPSAALALLDGWPASRTLRVEPATVEPIEMLEGVAIALGRPRPNPADSSATVPELAAALATEAWARGGLAVVVRAATGSASPPVSAVWATTRALGTLVEGALLLVGQDWPPIAVLLVTETRVPDR